MSATGTSGSGGTASAGQEDGQGSSGFKYTDDNKRSHVDAGKMSKAEAMNACADLHKELLDCIGSSRFGFGVCDKENFAFWKCYEEHRGMNKVKPPSEWFSKN
eukprot:GFYU01022754.1.p2 GENE.GFYU01022754.1~~GFYU01022754.1.p2  ORF type:complete len:103 (-),score=7.81 GFYU01022754.1:414-722(-)